MLLLSVIIAMLYIIVREISHGSGVDLLYIVLVVAKIVGSIS